MNALAMFTFTLVLLSGLMGAHIVNSSRNTSNKATRSEVKLGVRMVLDLTYRKHAREANSLARYLHAFLKAVELRFSDMTDPKITLFLADIHQMRFPTQGQFYLENDVFRNELMGWGIRNKLHDVLKKTQLFGPQKGVTLIMTGYDLWTLKFPVDTRKEPVYHGDITSSADQGGACTDSNVAVCEDNGITFSGVGSAAQAIALLLGAKFELEPAPPDTPEECLQKRGYLLSSYTGVSTHYNLSSCGKNQIKKKLESDKQRKRCLLEEPKIEQPAKEVQKYREFPYDFLASTNPCNLIYGLSSCESRILDPIKKGWKKVSGCRLRCCLGTVEKRTVNKHDGTPCEGGGICSNGQCISDPRNNTLRGKARSQ